MGWGEFIAWLEVMKRQNEPPRDDPGRWGPQGNADPYWTEMHRQRDQTLGR